MKKRVLLLLIVVGSVVMVSAEGRGNRDNKNRDNERPNKSMEEYFADDEIVSLTGKLTLENGEQAQITVKGATYTLMAPWQELSELALKDGQTVTVTGYEKTAKLQWDDSEKMLIVTSITIDGKVSEIEFKAMGRGRGRKGN